MLYSDGHALSHCTAVSFKNTLLLVYEVCAYLCVCVSHMHTCIRACLHACAHALELTQVRHLESSYQLVFC
jgi:hypothetical protein